MDIYIKPKKKVVIKDKNIVTIKDIADVVSTKDVVETVEKMKIFKRNEENKKLFLISVTEIINNIKKKYPDYNINNVGEIDTIIEFEDTSKSDSIIFKWIKIVFISLVLITGGAIAIMGFNLEAQIYDILNNFRKILLGSEYGSKWFIEIPYSIGIFVGIIVFFNRFGTKNLTNDPTPIEVEMSLYEEDVLDTVIEKLDTSKEKIKNKKEG